MTKSRFPNEYPCNGEIYYIVNDPLQPSIGTELWSNRCGIIVSNDTNNKNSGFVEIVYLSTSTHKRLSPTHIPVISGTKKAIAICEQVHTVDNSRLKTYIGNITQEEMSEIKPAILFGLGINKGLSPQGIFKKWEEYIKTYHLNEELDTLNPIHQTSEEPTIQSLQKELYAYKNLAITLQKKLDNIHILTQ